MTDPISVDPGVLRKPSSHMHRDTPCLLNCKKCSGQWCADIGEDWGYKLGPGVGVSQRGGNARAIYAWAFRTTVGTEANPGFILSL